MHGARLCQCEARAQATLLSRGVDRNEKIDIAALAENDEGEGASRDCRAMRSVESRPSHRLRIRCELETLLHTVPLHDPGSGMTATVAREARGQAGRTDAPSFSLACRRGRRAGERSERPARPLYKCARRILA